jgi:hypothetical protein
LETLEVAEGDGKQGKEGVRVKMERTKAPFCTQCTYIGGIYSNKSKLPSYFKAFLSFAPFPP